MNVTFYTHSKRRNSTSLPSGGTTYTCLLKSGTSTSSPTIMLKWNGTSSAPAAWNYCYIPDFGRYYWVNSWTYEERQWTASCSVDVLATYKTEIGSSSKYVLRAASDYDPEINDTMYPAKLKRKVVNATAVGSGFNWADDLAGGTIIVGIVGMKDTVAYSSGGVSYYATTPAGYIKFLSDMYAESLDNVDNENYGSSFGDAIKAFCRNLLRSVTNPTQYIKSAQWFPFTFSTAGAINPIVGGISSTATFYPLSDPIKNETVDFSLTVSADDYWTEIPPFKQVTAYLPPYGTFPLDMKKLAYANNVRLFIKTDAVSGLSHLTISSTKSGSTANPTYAETITQVGVPMDFSGLKTGGTSFGAVASAVRGYASGDLVSAAAGITSAIETSMPAVESRSSYGGISGDIADKYVETISYEPVDQDVAERGRPLCAVTTLNTLSGYILCADGDVACAGTENELAEIEGFLTGGFFYE